MQYTPQSLLDRLANDPADANSWATLVSLYTPFLRYWSQRLVNPSEADLADIVQNVLAVVVAKLPTFHYNQRPGAFRAWLKSILINVHREHFRARMPAASADALAKLESQQSDLAVLFEEEHRAHLVRCLVELATQRFPAETMSMFRQVVLEGKPTAEVARLNRVSDNVVYLAKSRVLSWLRDEGKWLIDEDLP